MSASILRLLLALLRLPFLGDIFFPILLFGCGCAGTDARGLVACIAGCSGRKLNAGGGSLQNAVAGGGEPHIPNGGPLLGSILGGGPHIPNKDAALGLCASSSCPRKG